MRTLFLLIAITISATVLCQNADSIKFRKVRLGLVFSPAYCYRLLKYDASYKVIEDLRNKEEVPLIGFTTGPAVRIDLTRKIILETGLYFSQIGQQTKKADLIWTNPGTQYPIKSKTVYRYNYLDIPVIVNYFFCAGRLKYFISGGVSVNIFTEKKTKVILEYADGHQTSASSSVDLGFLKFNLAAVIGLGITGDINERISISAGPVYRQFMNSIVAEKGAKEYPYSIGANIAIYYAFKQRK